jgi:hypothetical protein
MKAAKAVRNKRVKQIGSQYGTSIVWTELRSTYRGANLDEAREWMSKTELKLRSHLGVTFHRLIAKGIIQIDIVVDEVLRADDAIGTPVKAIDPVTGQVVAA